MVNVPIQSVQKSGSSAVIAHRDAVRTQRGDGGFYVRPSDLSIVDPLKRRSREANISIETEREPCPVDNEFFI